MEKTIVISEKEVVLDNNANWFFIYRDQFGHDIIPTLMPLLSSTMSLAAGLIKEVGKTEEIELKDVIAIADSEAMINALIHLSGLEFVEFINITWAMAKNADDSIPDPSRWVRQFDNFPVDVIAPVLFELIVSCVVTSKNFERVRGMMSKITPHPENENKTK